MSRLIPTYRLLLAGVIATFASMVCAEVITDAQGNRYYLTQDGKAAELTFMAADSTNATAYVGDLTVPETVKSGMKKWPVKGVTQLACANCDQLQSVTLPEGVTSIGLGAFADCTSLQSISLPLSLTTLHDLAFYRDSALLQADVPASVVRMGNSAFAFCTHLDSVGMQQGLRSIARQAFYYCTSLHDVFIPATVDAIGEYAFAYCSSLQQIKMESGPLAVTPDVFEGVNVSACRLVVPSDQVEAYREADVWCDFDITDGGYDALPDIERDDSSEAFWYTVRGHELWITINGDAPALIYDLSGRRIAVAASQSGENRIALTAGQHYIIRCGRQSRVITL